MLRALKKAWKKRQVLAFLLNHLWDEMVSYKLAGISLQLSLIRRLSLNCFHFHLVGVLRPWPLERKSPRRTYQLYLMKMKMTRTTIRHDRKKGRPFRHLTIQMLRPWNRWNGTKCNALEIANLIWDNLSDLWPMLQIGQSMVLLLISIIILKKRDQQNYSL